jgi:hypothetical protein
VRLGFTTYIAIAMKPVDPADATAVQAAMAPVIARMDAAIERARLANIALCVSFLTAGRDQMDELEAAAQSEDRRNMQWYSTDNAMASGWVTLSRYARRQDAIREAYLREVGRQLARRMVTFPETLVAASGDGEIELAYGQGPESGDPRFNHDFYGIADYSPFAVAEFRDWLRQGGLYAPGQPFAGQAWASSHRYAGDASPALDSNGDGHTLNGDYATTYSTWNLKHFDWSLADDPGLDPAAIPASQYGQAAFDPLAAQAAGGFDPPRVHKRGDPWSDLWDLFRQTMVWRHNLEFAKRITTSTDPLTGATVPAERWFTDQIPSDYLFGYTAANPLVRHDTAASPIWTANVSPYGSMGITAFNVNFNETAFARTLAVAAPVVASHNVRWGVFEWNPSVPKSAGMQIYRDEMALVEQYRPSLLAPFIWGNLSGPGFNPGWGQIEDTNFEVALRELIDKLNHAPLTLSRTALDVAGTTAGEWRSPAQTVRVTGFTGETPRWSIASAPDYLDVVPGADGRSFTVTLKAGAYAAGVTSGSIVIAPADEGYGPATVTVTRTIKAAHETTAPAGSVDTPAEDAVVSGELPVTGWAVDDLGLSRVSVFRLPVAGEASPVFVGDATFVPGARPDVMAAFPGRPLNDQAGWGYMLLTNMLPNGGNGVFTLSILASDVDGHSVTIAQRRIICRNSEATRPFGSVDTPGQGATVSGTIVNFGWALTPQPNIIEVSGSSIDVLIDGVVVGHPTYGLARSDVDTLFPGYRNSGGAVGYYVIDTTRLANGIHSIAWIVRDSGGGIQGIGSRFFTVAN